MNSRRASSQVFRKPRYAVRDSFRRLLRIFAVALVLLSVGVGLGTVGYHAIIGLSWIDSFLNASMVLAGEGPVVDVASIAGKIFVSIYSIFSGLVFVGVAVIIVTPMLRMTLRWFHLDDVIEEVFVPDEKPKESKDGKPEMKSRAVKTNRPLKKVPN